MANFLTGRHKFFKIEALDYNKYLNQISGKGWNMLGELLNDAAKILFEFNLEVSKVKGKCKSESF